MTIPRTLTISIAAALAAATPALGANLTRVASNFDAITTVTAPGGDDRLFVAEQRGTIRVVRNGQVLPTPFLDLTDRVRNNGEQGLLGLAFHPRFATNGRFFVNFSDSAGATVVSEFRVPVGANSASATTGRRLMRIPQPYANHNGGNLAFGPDGFLYIGMGDGGSGGDPENRAQRMNTRLGKMLRIDVNGTQGRLKYRIPTTNPYRTRRGVPPEIVASGLRNPWRFSFDRVRGDMWIADVGQNRLEEVNYVAKNRILGANFGWKRFEARSRFSNTPLGAGRLVGPVTGYDHGQGCSITGGFVYRGPSIPDLDGRYLFSDFCSSRIWSMRAGPRPGDKREITTALGLTVPQFGVRTFGEGGDGSLYVATGDTVWKFGR